MNNEHEIRALITRWAAAVHDGDLETALADHTSDIVMFDVPPPDPDKRLRLTLGLRKKNGKWSVAHEHHSFTIDN